MQRARVSCEVIAAEDGSVCCCLPAISICMWVTYDSMQIHLVYGVLVASSHSSHFLSKWILYRRTKTTLLDDGLHKYSIIRLVVIRDNRGRYKFSSRFHRTWHTILLTRICVSWSLSGWSSIRVTRWKCDKWPLLFKYSERLLWMSMQLCLSDHQQYPDNKNNYLPIKNPFWLSLIIWKADVNIVKSSVGVVKLINLFTLLQC